MSWHLAIGDGKRLSVEDGRAIWGEVHLGYRGAQAACAAGSVVGTCTAFGDIDDIRVRCECLRVRRSTEGSYTQAINKNKTASHYCSSGSRADGQLPGAHLAAPVFGCWTRVKLNAASRCDPW